MATHLPTKPTRRPRGILIAAVATVGLAVAGAGIVAAQTGSDAHRDMPVVLASGPFGWGGPPGGGFMGGRMANFMEWRIERSLSDIGASPEQIARVKEIADAAREDVSRRTRELRSTPEAVRDILTDERIDRAAAERLRAERFAEVEAISRRITTAMLDAAEVLTPEQRAALAERMQERRRGWRGPW